MFPGSNLTNRGQGVMGVRLGNDNTKNPCVHVKNPGVYTFNSYQGSGRRKLESMVIDGH